MKFITALLTNGFLPLIPVLIWNAIFTSKLPKAFSSADFDNNISNAVLIVENVFRVMVFFIPLLLKINIGVSIGKRGVIVYAIGLTLYFLSWLILIYFPDCKWSHLPIGLAAPAYTPIIWMIGLSMMFDSFYGILPYSRWMYILPCTVFCLFHTAHTVSSV